MSAKNLIVKPIQSRDARAFIKRNHYSGKVVQNSQLHFGVFWNGKCEGVLQFGPCMRKEYMQTLIDDTEWNGFIELNRMAFTEKLPRNSESRSIAICIKLIKKHYPHIKWIISFADGCQCGDGTIYRASGFVLTGIKENVGLRIDPESGEVMSIMQAYHLMKMDFNTWEKLKGYQFRYIYFIDKSFRDKLTVPEIPFSKINELGAGMYKGQRAQQGQVSAPLTTRRFDSDLCAPLKGDDHG